MTTPFIPGQVYVGSKVSAEPQIFAANVITQQGIRAGGLTPTVALFGTNSGTGASVSSVTGFDQAARFTITAGTAPAAGTACTVTFGRPLTAAPSSITVSIADTTAGATTNPVGSALAYSKTGFSVYAGTTAMVVAHTYLVSYQVIQ